MSDPYAAFHDATRARVGDDVDGWLAELTAYIGELVERWELALGTPFAGGSIGYTVAATRGGNEPVVLKITFPDGWFPEEVAALARWDGDGVVELIDHDPRGAMLLERAVPGTTLLEDPDEDRAMLLAADILERLWPATTDGITPVADEVGRWATTFDERNAALGGPVPADLAHEAVDDMRGLLATPREAILLHGDLHLGNVLAAEREPWLAIDPKPLVGDREFDVTALIRDRQDELVAHPDAAPRRLQRRFDLLADRLACDRDRLRSWSVAVMTDYALGCFEEQDPEQGSMQLAVAELLRRLRP